MKRFVISATLILLLAASAGSAASLKSMMMVGPYVGWSLGFGDAFKDYEIGNSKFSSSAGLNFGGNFHYGLSDKMMVGGEIYIQSFKYKAEIEGFGSSSDTESGTNFLFSGLYAMSQMQKAIFLLNAGAGLYDGGSDSDIGLFGGVMYQRLLKAKMTLYILARMHFIMADDTITMLQLAVGLHFWLGSTGAPMEM